MAVAKTYEKYDIKGEPFVQDGKKYVRVVGPCPRCGGSGHYSYNQMDGTRCYGCNGAGKVALNVRWYTDKQRAAMDKANERAAEKRHEKAAAAAKAKLGPNWNGFGDENGHITVVLGNTYDIKNELKAAGAHFKVFGWFFTNETPVVVPEGYETLELTWEQCSTDGIVKSEAEIKSMIADMVRKPSLSNFQGEIGKKLTFVAKVTRAFELDGRYGVSYMHTFEDNDGNVYVWTTTTQCLEVGKNFEITGTVKDHSVYNDVNQTVMTRCKVKEI